MTCVPDPVLFGMVSVDPGVSGTVQPEEQQGCPHIRRPSVGTGLAFPSMLFLYPIS